MFVNKFCTIQTCVSGVHLVSISLIPFEHSCSSAWSDSRAYSVIYVKLNLNVSMCQLDPLKHLGSQVTVEITQ